jgi:hypothetical protein
MSLPAHESDLLRQMVRQVLQEIVPQTMSGGPSGAPETVTIASDADLQSFARRVAGAPQAVRDAILAGTTTFALGGTAQAAASASGPATTAAAEVRVEKGAVTERHVREAASAGAVLVLGRKAVLTPLARDRARAAGVEITKEK